MPRRCIPFDVAGGRGFITMHVAKKDMCADCDRRLMVALCDGPVGHGKTCDRPICEVCRTHVGKNTDYCRQCAGKADTQTPLFNGPQGFIEVK